MKCEGCLNEVAKTYRGKTWGGEDYSLCPQCLTDTIDDMTNFMWAFTEAVEKGKVEITVEGADFDLHLWLSRLAIGDFGAFGSV